MTTIIDIGNELVKRSTNIRGYGLINIYASVLDRPSYKSRYYNQNGEILVEKVIDNIIDYMCMSCGNDNQTTQKYRQIGKAVLELYSSDAIATEYA